MRSLSICFLQFLLVFSAFGIEKEWTHLIFLNGHNNLDSFGEVNVKQLETIGSTADINIVVQWASQEYGKTRRLLVTKSTDPSKVTSPVVEELPPVDMGDYKALNDFAHWTVQHYPAKHYKLTLWNHGAGWHRRSPGAFNSLINIMDISFDDISGNKITTKQLGLSMADFAKTIGHKVDLLGSDACLMAMAEVGYEVADSVRIFMGSEETESALGWPYDKQLARWILNPKMTAEEVAKIYVEEYTKYYTGGGPETSEATFSAFNLEKSSGLNTAIKALGQAIAKANASDQAAINTAIGNTTSFTYSDYKDLGHFLENLKAARLGSISAQILADAGTALNTYVIANAVSTGFSKAAGASLWIPSSRSEYDTYATKYQELKFDSVTSWHKALEAVLK